MDSFNLCIMKKYYLIKILSYNDNRELETQIVNIYNKEYILLGDSETSESES